MSSDEWGSKNWFIRQTKAIKDPKATTSYFSHHVNGYQRFRHQKLVNIIKNLEDVDSILDIGCGTGHLLNAFKLELSAEVATGTDFMESVVKKSQEEFPNCNFIVATLPEIPAKEDSYDLVVASEVLYYLSQDERIKAIKKIKEIMKENGSFFVTSKIGGKYFSEATIKELLDGEFNVTKTYFIYSELYHKVIYWPYRIVHLVELVREKNLDGNHPYYEKINKIKVCVNTLRLQSFLSLLSTPLKLLIKSKKIPELCNWIASKFGDRFKSNIIVIAKR